MKRRSAGFSFIEILVVMSIIVVLVSMVVVVVPMIQEKAKQTKSTDNVRSMIQMYLGAGAGVSKPWPAFNGKNFVLWLVATNKISKESTEQLSILFSPGDPGRNLDSVGRKAFEPVTLEALRSEGNTDFLNLTSYAGRRNKDKGHQLTSSELEKSALIICDDDDGALHHSKGLVMGYSSGAAKFADWSDLEISPPADSDNPEGLLGDNAPTTVNGDELKHMSSRN